MINLDELRKAQQDIMQTPVDEIVATAAAFLFVTEKIIDQSPEAADPAPQLMTFLTDVADAVELLLA